MKLNKYIDHTLFKKANATEEQIDRLLSEARTIFCTSCVILAGLLMPNLVLQITDIRFCTEFVGFPL